MTNKNYDWAVIGSGPAGLAAVGQLLDNKVPAEAILWVDPKFTVGDFGTTWSKVSSNTSVRLFKQFYQACQSFDYAQAPQYEIESLDPEQTCYLAQAAAPLAWITARLMQKVTVFKGLINKIAMKDRVWILSSPEGDNFLTNNVILATGSEPSTLPIQTKEIIPLETALNKEALANAVEGKKRIAVMGSAHSAIIIVRDLLELGVPQVDNYYLEPLRYAIFFPDWTLFDNTGLKGKTAIWAKENLHGNLPKNLNRYLSTPENLEANISDTDATIFATGFKRRRLKIEGFKDNYDYNPHCGIIAPGLFGFGIAFPEKTIDRFGHQELSVGLWKFMDYLKRVMPVWLNYTI